MRKHPGRVAAGAALALVLLAAAADVVVVKVQSTAVRQAPQFFAPVVATVKAGDKLSKVAEANGWFQVKTTAGASGWIHSGAVEKPKVSLLASSSAMKTQATSSEVALAGKGFNKQVEESYKAKTRRAELRGRGQAPPGQGDTRTGGGFPQTRQAEPLRRRPMSARRRIPAVLAVVVGLLLASTAAQAQLGGILDKVKKGADTANKAAKVVRSTFGDISEEEEYYIGRSVAALILSRYQPLANPGLSQYVNTLGQAVALSSDRPETFAGYHFQVLDTDEVNALAAPGGMIFLTKGLLKRCPDEETLAAILAHEIGHVAAKHGLQSIKKSRLVDAFKLLEQGRRGQVRPGGAGPADRDLRGRPGRHRREPDRARLRPQVRVRSRRAGLEDRRGRRVRPDRLEPLPPDHGRRQVGRLADKGWFKTHPTPEQRIDRADKATAAMGALPAILEARTARFKAATAGLK